MGKKDAGTGGGEGSGGVGVLDLRSVQEWEYGKGERTAARLRLLLGAVCSREYRQSLAGISFPDRAWESLFRSSRFHLPEFPFPRQVTGSAL